MKKSKVFNIIFIISFIPILALLFISLYYAIFGYDVYTMILPTYVKTIYGIEAFVQSFTWNAIVLIFIPVLPIMFLYQIIFLIVKFILKLKTNKNIIEK